MKHLFKREEKKRTFCINRYCICEHKNDAELIFLPGNEDGSLSEFKTENSSPGFVLETSANESDDGAGSFTEN